MRLIMYPYNMGSASARDLANELGIRRVYPDRRYKNFRSHLIINWGSSVYPNWHRPLQTNYVNDPSAVLKASDKRQALYRFTINSVACPKFFTTKEDLIHYTDGLDTFPRVYCRQIVSGQSGRGIVIAESPNELVSAPLYTLGFNTRKEWRIHVFQGQVIDFAKKACRDGERPSGLIRNYASGWIFRRDGVEPTDAMKELACKAVACLGLDFGAVDIAEDREGTLCVFEVNTACGIGGESTLQSYANAFRRLL